MFCPRALVFGTAVLFILRPVESQGQDANRTLVYDEGHNNFPSARMAGLLDIGRSLGLAVQIGQGTLDSQLAGRPTVLVVCVPASLPDSEFVARFREPRRGRAVDWAYWSLDYDQSPYTDLELRTLVDWIHSGGSLFLIIDHAPGPAHARALARAIGVDVRNAFTSDRSHYPPGYAGPSASAGVHVVPGNNHWIHFSRSTHTIGPHPITDGITPDGRLDAVATYTGSSIVGPVGSTPLLILSDSAVDVFRPWPDGPEYRIPSHGRSQATAFTLGSGRVVVIAEAGALMKSPFGSRFPDTGLDYANAGNRKFAENSLRWLIGTNR
jgi:hypothetical protein